MEAHAGDYPPSIGRVVSPHHFLQGIWPRHAAQLQTGKRWARKVHAGDYTPSIGRVASGPHHSLQVPKASQTAFGPPRSHHGYTIFMNEILASVRTPGDPDLARFPAPIKIAQTLARSCFWRFVGIQVD